MGKKVPPIDWEDDMELSLRSSYLLSGSESWLGSGHFQAFHFLFFHL